jgi:hypothetical protein
LSMSAPPFLRPEFCLVRIRSDSQYDRLAFLLPPSWQNG